MTLYNNSKQYYLRNINKQNKSTINKWKVLIENDFFISNKQFVEKKIFLCFIYFDKTDIFVSKTNIKTII
jgi:hypothetical protein